MENPTSGQALSFVPNEQGAAFGLLLRLKVMTNILTTSTSNTYYPYGDPVPNTVVPSYPLYPNYIPPTTTVICTCVGCCHCNHFAEALALSLLNNRIIELEARIKELEAELDKPQDN